MAPNFVKQIPNKTVKLRQNILTNHAARGALYSLLSSSSSACSSRSGVSGPKEFDCIPGPRAVPIIGNLWRYLPLIGEYSLYRMDGNGRLNLRKYGKIVREYITASHQVLHLFDPVHIEEMFKQEDRYPYRRSHRALLKFRRERPHLYKSGGIFPENGPEWARLRDIFKRHFLLAHNINPYDCVLNQVADDTVQLLRTVRDKDTCLVTELQAQMYKWSLESICAILLDCRMGCLAPHLPTDSDAARLINAGNNTIEMVAKTELYSGWEKRPNRAYRSLERSQDDMSEIVYKHFTNKIRHLEGTHNGTPTDKGRREEEERQTLLTQFIRDPDIDRKDLFGMLVDSVMAGIDTTSITASFVCYFLSENQHYQNTLRDEIRDALSRFGVSSLKAEHFQSMPWLKAIIKESLRLRPLSIGVGRLTSEECIIGGYKIPANTMIITQNQVSCQLAEYFDDPQAFKPERWFDSSDKHDQTKADTVRRRRQSSNDAGRRFLWLPFGHGRRMCLGRRIAELELYILISKLVTEFRIEPTHTEPDPAKRVVNTATMLINIPDRAINLRLIDLNNSPTHR